MKSIIFGLTLISVAVAQSVNGVSSVPATSQASGSASGSSSQATSSQSSSSQASSSYGGSPAAYTGSPSSTTAPSQYTPPPAESMSAMYSQQQQGYSSFMAGGYKSMNCGYGYEKGSDGGCSAMAWVRSNVCTSGAILTCYTWSIPKRKGVMKPLLLTIVVDMAADLARRWQSHKRSIKLLLRLR
jgi:hypothetical protein